jgi:Na+/H+ antiporter NhaD/arsenite permease-like protein
MRTGWAVVPFVVLACALPTGAGAAEIEGASLGLGWAIPFAGLLLTIAVCQAGFPKLWEHHFGKITLAWIFATVIPLAVREGGGVAAEVTVDLLVMDYLPFLISIFTLYVIAGGIHVRTRMSGHPTENVILLAAGTLASGLMGTPGATLLFLPIVLTSNRWRHSKVHTIVFFIFLVSNMGGGLTPLGPPLLMGYLKGVSFIWTMEAMALPTALGSAILLGLYWLMDTLLVFPREDAAKRAAHREENDILSVGGNLNILLLAAVVAVVVLCGSWQSSAKLQLGFLALAVPDVVRMVVMVALAMVSLRRTSAHIRQINQFSWGPMKEVAILFAGIFITMLPPLAILKAGLDGAMGGLIRLVTDPSGAPLNWIYFVITGVLSSFLDNAPTFLVFFNVAGGDANVLMGTQAATLTAISAGAAFWGGVTYIGNAPNFMVRSIAEERGTAMPSFFAFMLWSVVLLLPTFGVLAVIFFAAPLWMLAGVALPPVAGLLYGRSRATA